MYGSLDSNTVAGISAYTNIGKQINLLLAEEAFKGVEFRGDDYVIGIVSVSGSEDDDVHVYVQKDGWIVAYYPDHQLVPKIIKDLMNPADNKLEDALTKVCEKLNVHQLFQSQKPRTKFISGFNSGI